MLKFIALDTPEDWLTKTVSLRIDVSWQLNREGGAYAKLALHQDLALMLFYDLVGDTEAQTDPHAYVLGRKKRLKDPASNLLRNSLPGITYRDVDEFIVVPTSEHDLTRRNNGLAGIEQQVQENLVQLAEVTEDLRPRFVLFSDGGNTTQFVAGDGQGVLQR